MSIRAWVLAVAVLLAGGHRAVAEVVEVELTIATDHVNFTGKAVEALSVNGGIPGPTLEFNVGDVARIHVRNDLDVASSIHWHGLLLPADQDGVPYVSFPGIAPHTTFTYEFPILHAGTYWYHSHSGFQEQEGVYGSIVVHPPGGERHPSDRDYVAVLSDWTDERPHRALGLLKSGNEWYSIERKTNQSIFGAIGRKRYGEYLRRQWQSMPDNEISDISYDRFLINGGTDSSFEADPGDRLRLRIINAGAASYFYVQFAGGPMTVVAADGVDVEPVELNRLLIAIAETYDVLVTIPGEGAFELRATAQDGSGHAAAVVGSGELVAAPEVPQPDYYRNAMNAGYGRAMRRTAWDVGGSVEVLPPEDADSEHAMESHETGGDAMEGMDGGDEKMEHGSMAMATAIPGRPLPPYDKLRAVEDTTIRGERPTRVVKLNLTGDMERYVWSMNGRILRPSNTIRIRKGERVRFEMSNRTMMHHPMHLHGHFFRVLNGQGARAPLKHTIDVAPMDTTVIEFEANEEKDWFFHCHVLYHLDSGMARVIHYEDTEVDAETLAVRPELYNEYWYAFGAVGVLSQMSDGAVQVSNTRNIIDLVWEVGYDENEYDVTGAYNYYLNRYLTVFGGVNAYCEGEAGDDVRGVVGATYLLPLNILTSLWVGTDTSFRWTADKEFQLTRRLVGYAEVEYDSETDWEWVAGGGYIVTRHLAVVAQYHSEFGWGGGVRVRFHSSGF